MRSEKPSGVIAASEPGAMSTIGQALVAIWAVDAFALFAAALSY